MRGAHANAVSLPAPNAEGGHPATNNEPRTPEPRTPNLNPNVNTNVNTNREARTWKCERDCYS